MRAPRPFPCYRSYELPEDRSWESFRFVVQEGYGDVDDDEYIVTDELVTDDETERDRLLGRMRDTGYEPRVIERSEWTP